MSTVASEEQEVAYELVDETIGILDRFCDGDPDLVQLITELPEDIHGEVTTVEPVGATSEVAPSLSLRLSVAYGETGHGSLWLRQGITDDGDPITTFEMNATGHHTGGWTQMSAKSGTETELLEVQGAELNVDRIKARMKAEGVGAESTEFTGVVRNMVNKLFGDGVDK